MYTLEVREKVDEIFRKLLNRNRKQLEIINKKVLEICENPNRYKNLRVPLNSWKGVHIDSHFVLTFSVDEVNKKVILEDFDHHDNIYKK